MNEDDINNNDFSVISLNKLNPNKITRDIMFYLLLINTIFVLFLLILIFNPNTSIRKYFFKFIHASIFKIKLYHITMILIIGFYSFYYFYLRSVMDDIDVDTFSYFYERLIKFNKTYEIESKVWLLFIIIICLLSIYRHAYLINKEEGIKNSI